MYFLGESLCYDKRKDQRRVRINLNRWSARFDLPPTDSFVGPRSRITSVILLKFRFCDIRTFALIYLSRIHINGKIGSISHEVRIVDMVFHYSAA